MHQNLHPNRSELERGRRDLAGPYVDDRGQPERSGRFRPADLDNVKSRSNVRLAEWLAGEGANALPVDYHLGLPRRHRGKELEEKYLDLRISSPPEKLQRPVLYKLSGGVDKDSLFCVTEEDHVKFLGIQNPFPPCLFSIIQKKDTRILFLGYGLQNWNFRVMLRRLSDLAFKNMQKSWAIQRETSSAEREIWRSYIETCFEFGKLDFVGFAERLEQAADGKPANAAGMPGNN